MLMLARISALAAAAAAASAEGTVTYFWDINDTGSDVYVYSSLDESINFKLYALMEPEATAFAGTLYDILGGDDYSWAGVVTNYDNMLDELGTGPGELQPNNDILGIESLQLPPLFGGADHSNPILLYELDWQITGFFHKATVTSANHQYNAVYTDDFGSSEEYDAVTTTATVISPAPGWGPAAAVGLLAALRRRGE